MSLATYTHRKVRENKADQALATDWLFCSWWERESLLGCPWLCCCSGGQWWKPTTNPPLNCCPCSLWLLLVNSWGRWSCSTFASALQCLSKGSTVTSCCSSKALTGRQNGEFCVLNIVGHTTHSFVPSGLCVDYRHGWVRRSYDGIVKYFINSATDSCFDISMEVSEAEVHFT